MIFPWIQGIPGWIKAPLTWIIVILNIFIFIIVWDSQKTQKNLFEKSREIHQLGKMYMQLKMPSQFREDYPDKNELEKYGALALRDPDFLNRYSGFSFDGDQFEINQTLKLLDSYIEMTQTKWTYVLGLNSYSSHWTHWITYQFMHASWIHVLGNMTMLLIFGGAVEGLIGSFWFVTLYLISGIVGGSFFVGLTSSSVIPMVGASASLSGVIAFYAFFEVKKRLAFYYFLSPFPGYYGKIYLPKLLLFPLLFLQDIVGFLSADFQLSAGVAYTAHIGGAVAGSCLAIIAIKNRYHFIYQWFKDSAKNTMPQIKLFPDSPQSDIDE